MIAVEPDPRPDPPLTANPDGSFTFQAVCVACAARSMRTMSIDPRPFPLICQSCNKRGVCMVRDDGDPVKPWALTPTDEKFLRSMRIDPEA